MHRDPLGKCVGCGKHKSKMELIRIVNNKGQLLIDPGGDLAGRGVYICPAYECIKKAREGNKISKALKTTISDEFYQILMEEIGNE